MIFKSKFIKMYNYGGSDGKVSTHNVGDPGSIPGLGRSPGEGNGNPFQYCMENRHGQRSLVGYSPRSCKESDTIKQLSHTHTHTHTYTHRHLSCFAVQLKHCKSTYFSLKKRNSEAYKQDQLKV